MKALVTGASGFIGSHLCHALTRAGYEVTAMLRPNSNRRLLNMAITSEELPSPSEASLPFQIITGDITDRFSLTRAFQNHDFVFHAAAALTLKKSERFRLRDTNTFGTQNVIEAVHEAKVSRLVHISTAATLGMSSNQDVVFDERHHAPSVSPLCPNAHSKFEAEKLVLAAVSRGEIDAVVVNPSMVFGAGDVTKEMRGSIVKMARGKVPFYTPGGLNIVDIQDVVWGILKAAELGRNGERYILSGENLTGREFAELVASAAGMTAPRRVLSRRWLNRLLALSKRMQWGGAIGYEAIDASLHFAWYDHQKAGRELGYSPRPARDAVNASVRWMHENAYGIR